MAPNRNNVMLCFLALTSFSASAAAQPEAPSYKPPAIEALRTPRYCWNQFMGEKFRGREYSIPREMCGTSTNHYCPGLVQLDRANRTIGNESRRRAYLEEAQKNALYTLRGISTFPHCPIRADVETTLRIVEIKLRAFK